MLLILKKTAIGLLSIILIAACTSPKASEMTPEDKQELTEEIKSREEFKNPKAINLRDTSTASFKKLRIYNTHLNENIQQKVQLFYKQYGNKTRWLYTNGYTELFNNYLKVLAKVEDFGMNPETYQYEYLKRIESRLSKNTQDTLDVTSLDKQITASFLLLARHIIGGRVQNFSQGKKIWRNTVNKKNATELLLKVTDEEDLERAMQTLHPDSKNYNRMHKMLHQLNADTEKEEVRQFSFDSLKNFKIGYKDEKVIFLRENLALQGFDTRNNGVAVDTVDEKLLEAVAKYQKIKNIESDSIPGRRTLYYLNMTKEQKKELVILNMERMRWFNMDFGPDYIIVNIPQYKLFVVRDKKLVKEMNVIVGTQYTSTPVFSEKLEYIEFRPTWTVPQSIIRKEMIPKLQKNPNYYSSRGFTIYEKGKVINPNAVNWNNSSIKKRVFHFVQKPSPSNALGLVKFIMPNDLSIYLHDTPKNHLFSRKDRAFSHGCVRVEFPEQLAATLLEGQDDWNLEKVEKAIQSGKQKNRVYLKKEYQVEFLYLTAWVDDNNIFWVVNDIYGHDQNQLQELQTFIN